MKKVPSLLGKVIEKWKHQYQTSPLKNKLGTPYECFMTHFNGVLKRLPMVLSLYGNCFPPYMEIAFLHNDKSRSFPFLRFECFSRHLSHVTMKSQALVGGMISAAMMACNRTSIREKKRF